MAWATAIALGLQAAQGIVNYSQAERDRKMRRGAYENEVRRREQEMKTARMKMAYDKSLRDREFARSSAYQEQLDRSPYRA